MNDCEGKRVAECALDSPDCHYHEKCGWCGKYHFREKLIPTEPYRNELGLEGSRSMPSEWPPRNGVNVACAGRPK